MTAPQVYVYVDRDECPRPPLVNEDGLVLEAGSLFTCPHAEWAVVHTANHGGRPQPEWITSVPYAPSTTGA